MHVAVVDANALISGVRVDQVADKCVTTREVLDEVRDQQSLRFLETLPFGIEVSEPSDASVKAVLAFARATGDLHALSRADLRLVALAHTLEVAAHGSGHLRAEPVKRVVRSKKQRPRGMPGWDYVQDEEGWREVEEAVHDSSQPQAASKIMGVAAGDLAKQVQQLQLEPEQATPPTSLPAAALKDERAGDEAEDDGWSVAKKDNVRRRQQRREYRRAEEEKVAQEAQARALRRMDLEAELEQAAKERPAAGWGEASRPGELCPCCPSPDPLDPPPLQEQPASGEDKEAEGVAGPSSEQPQVPEDEGSDGSSSRDEGEYFEVESGSESGEEGDDGASASLSAPGFTSTITTITADFPMQNVLLQMGLHLTARDGMRIRELSRYALRCSACFAITKDAGRLFCPRCGNRALERVTIHVGPDGLEQFGVRRRHNLRGTRFSLPKPKGGRHGNSVAPLLREDVFLSKFKPPKRGKKTGDADDELAFAPEYNDETWFQANRLSGGKGAAYAMAAWKHNPNERKAQRTNRRRK